MSNNNLSIIIVNWNSGEYLANCIQSVQNDNACNFEKEIIIVDNDSSDNSLALVEDTPSIKKIELKKNIGFGGACNVGTEASKYEHILFLNPDVIVPKDVLCKIFEFYTQNEYAVVGIQQRNQNGIITRSCARKATVGNIICHSLGLYKFNNKLFKSYKMIDWDHEISREVDHIIGSFYLMSKNDFNAVEGFDERFFLYYEDFDLSLKIKQSNKKIYYWAEDSILHEGGGTTQNILDKRLYLSQKSKLIFFKKHFSAFKYFIIFMFIFFFEFVVRLLFSIVTLKFSQTRQVFRGYMMLYKS